MTSRIEGGALQLLKVIAEYQQFEGDQQRGHYQFKGDELSKMTGLHPNELNDAVEFLDERGAVDRVDYLGTHPYSFGQLGLTSRGRYLAEQLERQEAATTQSVQTPAIPLPRNPVGSPFRFEAEDWEVVDLRRKDSTRLFVAVGLQFQSTFYDTAKLFDNLKAQFEEAFSKYNERAIAGPRTLDFIRLAAGYGEHLFNRIARDIISSDIAVFDTSDRNSNVMIEMGVALTWGVRVLPIHAKGSEGEPPSDISGQTWAQYEDSAAQFVNPSHDEHRKQLAAMVERAARSHQSG